MLWSRLSRLREIRWDDSANEAKNLRGISQALSLISRALRISLFSPSQSAYADSSPQGEPLRENGLRQALLGESSRNAGERGESFASKLPHRLRRSSQNSLRHLWCQLPRGGSQNGSLTLVSLGKRLVHRFLFVILLKNKCRNGIMCSLHNFMFLILFRETTLAKGVSLFTHP